MKLLGNRIHVAPVIPDRVGSILLPEALRDQANIGGYKLWRVLQVGPGRLTRKGVLVPIECNVGDRLVTQSYTTGPITLGDGTSLITEDQVLAVVPQQPQPNQ